MNEKRQLAVLLAATGGSRWRWAVQLAAMALAIVIAASIFFYVQRARRIEEVASQAREAVKDGPIEEARILVAKWSALAPEDGEPHYYLAWLDIRANRPAHAMDSIRAAASKGYPIEPIEVLRAVLLAQAGRFEESVPILLNGFQRESGPLAEIADALVRYYMRTVRLVEAVEVIDRWIAVAPQDARPYVWRADIYERGGREGDLVIRDYREALSRNPGLDDTRLAFAEKLLKGAENDEADEEFTKILARRPRSAPVRVGLGRIALLKGDLQGATRHYEEALALDPSSPLALKELALLDVKFGRLKQAKDRLEKAVLLEPEDLELQYAYARVLAASGDTKAAAEQTQRAERLRSDQKRIEELRKQLAAQPDNLDLRLEVARWLIEHNHEEEGLDWTRRILTSSPDHPATCRLLADYYTRKQNPGLANYYRLLLGPADREGLKQSTVK